MARIAWYHVGPFSLSIFEIESRDMRFDGWFWPVIIAPFIGSFLGVLVVRLPRGEPIVWDRSRCDHCGHGLALRDLIPIASWLGLGGRCRYCGEPIARLFVGMEIGSVLIVLWAASAGGAPSLWATSILGFFLAVLAVIDFRDGVLPDLLTLPLIPLGLAVCESIDPSALWQHVIGAAVGFLAFAAIRMGYSQLRKQEGLGLGDAKLLAASGAWVSWQGLPSVVLIATLLTLTIILVMRTQGQSITRNQRVPFGPALCLGTWLVWLYGPLP
jgi:leader peptidase (prepilin peptidase) / N-methyltransferase